VVHAPAASRLEHVFPITGLTALTSNVLQSKVTPGGIRAHEPRGRWTVSSVLKAVIQVRVRDNVGVHCIVLAIDYVILFKAIACELKNATEFYTPRGGLR
jgi:hypothetical protein